MVDAPEFLDRSELVRDAYEYARSAHHGPARRGSTDIDHPLLVAELLAAEGFDDQVLAAALLHDVLEDTAKAATEVAERFGRRVWVLVDAMTEDASIEPYAERKAEHRARVLAAGYESAAIYLADKLARTRRYAADGGGVAPERLEHYRATVEESEASELELPIPREIGAELARLRPSAAEDPKGAPA